MAANDALESKTVSCKQCNAETDTLALFPGGICLDCYRPEGERVARTMTAEKLAAMWGGATP